MNKPLENTFQKRHYRILLVDDHLGYLSSAGYLEYKLNQTLNEYDKKDFESNGERKRKRFKDKYGEFEINKIAVCPENRLKNMEFRLKTEPYDLILLDLNFKEEIKCQKSQECEAPEPEYKTARCFYCDKLIKREEFKKSVPWKKPSDFYNELGAYWLRFEIRRFNPAIPVIIFTSKYENSIEMASKYGINEFNADYFEKIKLIDGNKEKGFYILVDKILGGIRRYEQSFRDKIEISDTREEAELEAKNRDYMQTRLWNVITEKLSSEIRNEDGLAFKSTFENNGVVNRFAILFIDFDGMKSVNDRFGYSDANKVIKKFTEKLSGFIDKEWKSIVKGESDFCKPVLGRYFRERGDEFLIIFPEIIDKEVERNGSKKGVHEFLDELWQNINDDKWQKDLFSIDEIGGKKEKDSQEHESEEEKKKEIKIENHLTSSMGLFVFPDDLSIRSIKRLVKYKENYKDSKIDKEESIKDISDIYSEMTKVAQILKEKAKSLEKNQICYFQKARPLKTKGEFYINPRVNIGIILSNGQCKKIREKDDLRAFLEYLTDDVAFDFEILEIDHDNKLEDKINKLKVKINKLEVINIHYHAVIYLCADDSINTIKNTIMKIVRIKNGLCGLIIWPVNEKVEKKVQKHKKNKNGIIVEVIQNIGKYQKGQKVYEKVHDKGTEWILTKDNRERHQDLILNIDCLKELKRVFFDVITKLAEKQKNDEYYPRFAIQRSLHNKFIDIKKDTAILQKSCEKKDLSEDSKKLVDFFDGLNTESPGKIWVSRRISNKDGEHKDNIIVTICVNDIAYEFLTTVSGRNMIKLQQYFDGFLKGFLAGDPDKGFLKRLSLLKFEPDSKEYDEHKKGGSGSLVCRNPLFSPVSPNVYYEICEPARVRIDICFKKEDK